MNGKDQIRLSHPVLIVEDNVVNQVVIRRILTKLDVPCEVVCNGRQALRAVEQGDYSAVLMDCCMPEMDGWAASTEIRKRGSQIPIIAMTANSFGDGREKCLRAGMTDYLPKPLTLEDVRAALSRIPRDISDVSSSGTDSNPT